MADHKRLDDADISAIEQVIRLELRGSEYARKVLCWLLHQSENLSRPVHISFSGADDSLNKLGHMIQNVVHHNGNFLDSYLSGFGTDFRFEYGCKNGAWNIWLSPRDVITLFAAETVVVDFEAIDKISLVTRK